MSSDPDSKSSALGVGLSAIPNGRLLLENIGLSRERVNAGGKTKVPVPAQLLKELFSIAASKLPFDADFYLTTYPDIKAAYEAGHIADPRSHFIHEGYIEGRFGSKPNVDDEYYIEAYPDVRSMLSNGGEVASALDHYLRWGAFEGRSPSLESEAHLKRWMAIFGR